MPENKAGKSPGNHSPKHIDNHQVIIVINRPFSQLSSNDIGQLNSYKLSSKIGLFISIVNIINHIINRIVLLECVSRIS
jgi:hypothetical protein